MPRRPTKADLEREVIRLHGALAVATQTTEKARAERDQSLMRLSSVGYEANAFRHQVALLKDALSIMSEERARLEGGACA